MAHANVSVRHSDYKTWLEVAGVGRIPISEATDDDFVGPLEVAEKMSLTSLRRALVDYRGTESPGPVSVTIADPETGEQRVIKLPIPTSPERCAVLAVDVPATKFCERHTYEFLPEPVGLALLNGGVLAVRAGYVVEGEAEPDTKRLKMLLEPLLTRSGAMVVHIDAVAEGLADYRGATVHHTDFWVVHVYIAVPTYGRDAAFALQIGRDALALLDAAGHGSLTRATTETLILGGHADLLVGQREGAWLDCKAQPYGADALSMYELAKDVSAFANSESGGLIIIGLSTHKVGDADTIVRVRPVPVDEGRVDRYRKALHQRVYPRLSGLTIREIDQEGGRIIIISVPPQPKALQPFLVKGAIREGSVLGSHVAIYVRDEDAAITAGVEEMHALIVAGRAALGYATSVPD